MNWIDAIRSQTAGDWQIFEWMEESDHVAEQMNSELIRLLTDGLSKYAHGEMPRINAARWVMQRFDIFCSQFEAYGACDTEPRWVMTSHVNDVMGTDIDW
jgi:hypothetical protein